MLLTVDIAVVEDEEMPLCAVTFFISLHTVGPRGIPCDQGFKRLWVQ